MSRLLYKADHLAELESTYEDLRVSGVSDDHLHVIAKSKGEFFAVVLTLLIIGIKQIS